MTASLTHGSATFDELIDKIAADAKTREHQQVKPHEQIRLLRDAGFGALRVPVDEGGSGASLIELFEIVIRLAHADSNLAHILRSHFWFVEDRLQTRDPVVRKKWLAKVVDGELFGNASSETGTRDIGDFQMSTTITPADGGGYRINGVKYYSTGTLYSSYVAVIASTPEGWPVSAVVPLSRAGVTVEDDWDGFGQQLTATGTTRFDDVHVTDDEIFPVEIDPDNPARSLVIPFLQLYITALIAGNLKALRDDAVALLKSRQRGYTHGSAARPVDDPVLQQEIGEIASNATAAEAVVLHAARVLAKAFDSVVDGVPDPAAAHAASLATSEAKVVVDELGTRSATQLFNVGGASATKQSFNYDRHWRNIRTLASHNPTNYKARTIGDYYVNGAELPNNGYF